MNNINLFNTLILKLASEGELNFNIYKIIVNAFKNDTISHKTRIMGEEE